jgi:glycosyltransferase involved in cell wall biosynthesis
VLPAYNAAATLEKTIADVPKEFVSEFILVDDVSRDETVSVAHALAKRISQPFTIQRHDKNLGYGGNQKTCYSLALEHGADIVVMLHPDYQYDPKLVKYFVEFIRDGYFDVVLGSRIRTRREALEGGMPLYKYIANRFLTLWENLVSGQNLSEWHTGMRAYTKAVLEKVPYQDFSDDFVFDTQMLFGIIEKGFRIGDIPVPVRYFKEASSINFKRSVTYGLTTVCESLKHVGRRIQKAFTNQNSSSV